IYICDSISLITDFEPQIDCKTLFPSLLSSSESVEYVLGMENENAALIKKAKCKTIMNIFLMAIIRFRV
ncbi:MAG: hypothetical protein VW986_04715, partial [Gammaproteobacteria bacterium]